MNRRRTAKGRLNGRGLIALAMACFGLWIFSLTGAVDGFLLSFQQLHNQSKVAVALFPLPLEGDVYGLLPYSSLITASQDDVWARLGQAPPPPQEEVRPIPPEHDVPPPIYAQGDDDGEDTPNLPVVDNVFNFTARGDDGGNYIWADNLYVANRTEKQLRTDDILPLMGGEIRLAEGAKILIVHTHGTEAYTPVGEDTYVESDPYRTTNNLQNIVQVGADMAACFRDAGYVVLHDTNLYDYPDYNSSYTNSRAAVEGWLAQYPDIALILDVHRDALTAQDGTPYRLIGEGGDTAQMMLVVGSDCSATHPNWQENFSLALQLQQQLTADWGDLIRPTTLRSSRFNQDLSSNFLLLEVGGHGNSLQDARNAALCFAQSVIKSLKEG